MLAKLLQMPGSLKRALSSRAAAWVHCAEIPEYFLVSIDLLRTVEQYPRGLPHESSVQGTGLVMVPLYNGRTEEQYLFLQSKN